MNFQKFTQKSIQAVNDLERIAMEYGNQEIEQEHLLYSLLTQEESLIARLIAKMGIDETLFLERVEQALNKRVCGPVSEPGADRRGGRGEADGRRVRLCGALIPVAAGSYESFCQDII